MPVPQRFANATSPAAHAAMQPTLLVERFADMTPGAERPSPAGLTVVAMVIFAIILGTAVLLCAVCMAYRTCGRQDPAHRFSKPKFHGCYLTQPGPNKPFRRDEEHNSKPPYTPASIAMNDWSNKKDSSDSAGLQYVGARSSWGHTPGYGVAVHQPGREEFASAALGTSLQAVPLAVPPKVNGANRKLLSYRTLTLRKLRNPTPNAQPLFLREPDTEVLVQRLDPLHLCLAFLHHPRPAAKVLDEAIDKHALSAGPLLPVFPLRPQELDEQHRKNLVKAGAMAGPPVDDLEVDLGELELGEDLERVPGRLGAVARQWQRGAVAAEAHVHVALVAVWEGHDAQGVNPTYRIGSDATQRGLLVGTEVVLTSGKVTFRHTVDPRSCPYADGICIES
ncbi:hypothetical protein DL768_002602 [Monosporascus sp. mg162]|nr:hypothetical protein DL768_002602 [Monosporascus sp. mg162]